VFSFKKTKNVMIIGESDLTETVVECIEKSVRYRLVGRVFASEHTYKASLAVGCDVPVFSVDYDDVNKCIKQNKVNIVVISDSYEKDESLMSEIVFCLKGGVQVYRISDFFAKLTKRLPVRHVRHEWVVPDLTSVSDDFYYLFHNMTNYMLGFVGLLVTLPLFPLFALLIRLDSQGPVFYTQARVGKSGRLFKMLKFRTMVSDAEHSGNTWTSENDARITGVGKFLRRCRLDEVPQFINILKGDMALIGPRPEVANLVEKFKESIPFYEYRLLVRPGITGWAQVSYKYSSSIEDSLVKLQYDLYWIQNRSFLLDLKIIFRSIKVMITGFGAL